MTDYRVYDLSREENIIFHAIIVMLGIMIALLMYRNIFMSVIIVPFIPKIRMFVTEWYGERRRQTYMVQFKDFLFLAATSISAGRSMRDAINEAVPGLEEIYGEDCLLAVELRAVYFRITSGNEDDVNVLADMAVRSGLEDVVDFVSIYSVCKSTGANLIESMNASSTMIIDKMTIEKEIREISKRKKSEGLLIFIMPVIVILFLNITSPDYIAPLYETLVGRMLMTGVIIANVSIYGVINRITRVKL